jgi:hypothetical protein
MDLSEPILKWPLSPLRRCEIPHFLRSDGLLVLVDLPKLELIFLAPMCTHKFFTKCSIDILEDHILF